MSHLVRFEVECKITPSNDAITDFHIAFEAIKAIIKDKITGVTHIKLRPFHVEPLEAEERREGFAPLPCGATTGYRFKDQEITDIEEQDTEEGMQE